MNLAYLKYASALAETSSFSRAAEACAVTQPALSNAISQLEAELGGRLFERTTRRVSLTAFGRHVLPILEGVVTQCRELEVSAENFFNPVHKLIRVGVSPLVDTRMLRYVLEPFCRGHEGAEVVYKECYLDDLDERLQSEQLDMMIRPYLAGRPQHAAFATSPFYEEQLYFIPPSATPAGSEDAAPVLVRDLADEVFVLTPDVCGLTATVQNLFAEDGLELRSYKGQALGYGVMQEWAALGIGAAILPRSKISEKTWPVARPLVAPGGAPVMIRQQLIWNRRRAMPAHISACLVHIQDVAPELASGLVA